MVNASGVLALNNRHAAETSPLDAAGLQRLLDAAFRVETVGDVDAFLIGLDQDADYGSPNFLWLRARLRRFVYVDRVVTAADAQRRGHAARLYRGLFAQAVAAGHDRVVCEVNLVPANPGSDAFHARLGFEEIGRATLPDGTKMVRYLQRLLRPQGDAAGEV